jgi:CRP-like cAMP-binding protein
MPERAGAAAAAPSPRQNHILAALPAQDYEGLLPYLDHVSMPLGWIPDTGSREYLYFPTTSIVSRCHVTRDGASAETALIGNDGLLGLTFFLTGEPIPGQSVVVCAGHGERLNANVLRQNFALRGHLQSLALRYGQALMVQMAQISVCSRHHTIEQRLCRWLLMRLDRVQGNALATTQQMIADSLGVRREGVSEAAARLQADGLIQYSRGQVNVLNRPGLEQRACECYGVLRHAIPWVQSGARHAVRTPKWIDPKSTSKPSGAPCNRGAFVSSRAAAATISGPCVYGAAVSISPRSPREP